MFSVGDGSGCEGTVQSYSLPSWSLTQPKAKGKKAQVVVAAKWDFEKPSKHITKQAIQPKLEELGL